MPSAGAADSREIVMGGDVERALTLLVHASRVSPHLRAAVATLETALRQRRWTDPDMFESWSAGAQWVIDRVEIEDGELFVPDDEPGVEGRDWGEAWGSWITEDYEPEYDDPSTSSPQGGEP